MRPSTGRPAAFPVLAVCALAVFFSEPRNYGVSAGVPEVPAFWFDFVEPRKNDDVRECNMDLWDDGNGGGWKNSGNYSKLQTYYTVCRDGLKQLKKDMAGRHGPVSDPAVWNFMCGVECIISDMMHLVSGASERGDLS